MGKSCGPILRLFCLFLFYSCCCCFVSKMSYKFVVKWPVSKEDFKRKRTTQEPFITSYRRNPPYSSLSERERNDCLRETVFNFMDVENLTFSLCLFSYPEFHVVLKSESIDIGRTGSLYLEYAYVATPYRIYRLTLPDNSHFKAKRLTSTILNSKDNGLFSKNYTTIYCQIHVEVFTTSSVLTQDNIKLRTYVQDKPPNKDTTSIGQRRIYDDPVRNQVYDFAISGNIPTFNESLAKHILHQLNYYVKQLESTELTALSTEYLIQHLSCENAQSILKTAIEKEILVLKDECIRFIAYKCKIHNDNQCLNSLI